MGPHAVIGYSATGTVTHTRMLLTGLQPGRDTIEWSPDNDPFCELGRMTEWSVLYQVDHEVAAYSCDGRLDGALLPFHHIANGSRKN